MGTSQVEAKVAYGSFTGILTGLVVWALVAYVPAFRSGLPVPVAALIPVAVAWLAHSVTGSLAPPTPRPVMPPAPLPPTGTVIVVPPGPAGAS